MLRELVCVNMLEISWSKIPKSRSQGVFVKVLGKYYTTQHERWKATGKEAEQGVYELVLSRVFVCVCV